MFVSRRQEDIIDLYMSAATPMIRQYERIKNSYPDSILFFRLGDFYEMFFEDAKIASKILGITLTSRNKNDKNPIPLCGVPYHSADTYIAKLLKEGYKVAICEQVEDPKNAKGIVERRVVKVLTPGAIIDSEKLESKSNNYIAVIYKHKNTYGLSFSDISTGQFKTTEFQSIEDLKTELSNIEPKELLIHDIICEENPELITFLKNSWNTLVSKQDFLSWDTDTAKETLLSHYKTKTLTPFGLEGKTACKIASAILLDYIKETQMEFTPFLTEPHYYSTADYMIIDEATKRNLELVKPLNHDTSTAPTLLWVLDKTHTAMGGRLLKQWLLRPLIDVPKIHKRLLAVRELKEKHLLRENIRKELKNINDMERLVSRISTPAAKPRDLGGIRDSSYYLTSIKRLLEEAESSILKEIRDSLDDLSDLREYLGSALQDNLPPTIKDGGIIKEGFNAELDELRKINISGKKWISDLEEKEREKTGISSLKIGYNKVFGYYIEITKANLHNVPENYIRKQTLANAERFITPELKEYEEKVETAQEKIQEIEKKIFEQIRTHIAKQSERIIKSSSLIATLDILCSFAEVAEFNDYVMPEVDESNTLCLKESRHPVLERLETEKNFIPNDVILDDESNQLLLITGPNMAGKSTLIRQTALITIMAQTGSFVPASYARVGIADKVFTRVGASDNLSRGLSTFMVEMVETAYILRNATSKSLVILDEIGRGTSTFDGMSIAWAVAEYLHDLGARTLFATHYHELANLATVKTRIKNYNVSVIRRDNEIIFLRKLVPGASSHSYGIDVARLAGNPLRVISTARKILRSLERMQNNLSKSITGEQFPLFEIENKTEDSPSQTELSVLEEIRSLDPNHLTPIDALMKLVELKEKLQSEQ